MSKDDELKELSRFFESLHPNEYVFDKELVDDIEDVINPLVKKYEKSDKTNAYLKKTYITQQKFYQSVYRNESRHLDDNLDYSISIIDNLIDKTKQNIKNKEYSKKEKINYFSKRVNDKNLTHNQRVYAKNRIEYLNK